MPTYRNVEEAKQKTVWIWIIIALMLGTVIYASWIAGQNALKYERLSTSIYSNLEENNVVVNAKDDLDKLVYSAYNNSEIANSWGYVSCKQNGEDKLYSYSVKPQNQTIEFYEQNSQGQWKIAFTVKY